VNRSEDQSDPRNTVMLEIILIILEAAAVLFGWWWLMAHKLKILNDQPFKRRLPLL
jgi:predicted secreted protein